MRLYSRMCMTASRESVAVYKGMVWCSREADQPSMVAFVLENPDTATGCNWVSSEPSWSVDDGSMVGRTGVEWHPRSQRKPLRIK